MFSGNATSIPEPGGHALAALPVVFHLKYLGPAKEQGSELTRRLRQEFSGRALFFHLSSRWISAAETQTTKCTAAFHPYPWGSYNTSSWHTPYTAKKHSNHNSPGVPQRAQGDDRKRLIMVITRGLKFCSFGYQPRVQYDPPAPYKNISVPVRNTHNPYNIPFTDLAPSRH